MPVSRPLKQTLLRLSLAGAFFGISLVLAGGMGNAFAQAIPGEIAPRSGMVEFKVVPGRLNEVLGQFGQQAQVMVGSAPALTEGRVSPGVQGWYSVEEGLARLLTNTGLDAVLNAPGRYILRLRPDPSDNKTMLAPVVVLGQELRPQDEAFRTAGSSSYLSQADIERWRGVSVGDMFSNTPGVLVGENRNSGGVDINIRGMQGQGRVPVLIDGARQETTVSRGYSGVSSRSYLDPDLIAAVDIQKGPTDGAAGTGAIGGLVSMRTLDAGDIVRDGATFGARVRLSAIGNTSSVPARNTVGGLFVTNGGYYNDNCRYDCTSQLPAQFGSSEGMGRPGAASLSPASASVAVAGQHEQTDWVVAMARRKVGNYHAGTKKGEPAHAWIDRIEHLPFNDRVYVEKAGDTPWRAGEQVLNSSSDNLSVLLKGTLRINPEHTLQASYMRYESDYGEMMPTVITRGTIRGGVVQGELSNVVSNTQTLRYNFKPTAIALVDLRANIWRTALNSHITTPDILSYNSESRTDERYVRTGAELANTARWNSGLGDLSLETGLSWQREALRSSSENMSYGMTGSDLLGTYGSPGRDGNREEYGIYGTLVWQPTFDWTLTASLRHIRFKTQDNRSLRAYENPTCIYDCKVVDFPPYTGRHSATSPSFSALYDLTDTVQLYARYATGARMASLFESTSGFSVSPQLDMRLKPERARNWEFGINFLGSDLLHDGDQLGTKLAYFRNSTRDYLTRVPAIPNIDTGEFRMANIQRADFRGFELSANYDAKYWFAGAGATYYTHINMCYDGDLRTEDACRDYGIRSSFINNAIPPKWSMQANLGTRLIDQRLTLGVRVRHLGRRSSQPKTPYDGNTLIYAWPNEWRPYTITDVFASFRINKQLSVDFNIDNLTDRYYVDALSLGMVPAPGRTARLGLTWQM